MIHFLDGRVTLYVGQCLEALAAMEPDSVDCVVTSPPYWGLRYYGVDGQIGLEPTLAEHLAVMVAVFEAVRRVLKPTGTCLVNYGDCYATSPNGRSAADTKTAGRDDRTFRDKPFSTVQGVLKGRDLCMVPNRLAIALQEAGWWVRSEIIWGKPNPMPDSSGAYRPSTAHEKIFMLTKSCDGDVWRARDTGEMSFNPDRSERCGLITKPEKLACRWVRVGAHYDAAAVADGRYLRNYEPAPVSVWPIATQPFSEAHFATFPPELAERCILAGCPKGGLVLDPFGGAGTTALVALRHNRQAALIELNPDYAELARCRIEREWRAERPPVAAPLGGLFAGLDTSA